MDNIGFMIDRYPMWNSIFSHKKQFSFSVNIFWLNVAFSLFYWVMESVRDVIVFEKGDIFERIFKPDPMSFWMRMLVIFIFILFSVYSSTLREKIEVKKIRVSKSTDAYGIIWAGVGFGALYWSLESFRDVFVFERGDFLHRFIVPDPMGFWMRIMVVLILMLFSIYAQSLVDERRKAEEALKKTHDKLEQQVRERTIELSKSKEMQMEAIGILAGGVAHDYNNLLTSIQGLTELVMLEIDDKNPIFEDLAEILSTTKRAADLTQQLLLFSRKKTMQMVSLNFNKLVNSLLKKYNGLNRENIEILTNFETEPWTVKADKGTVERMIMNLMVNAKDAMPNGGKIVIKTENVHVDELVCRDDPEARPGQFVRLTISDDGMGMSNETLRHIFEPFFTTKGVGKGTGLGLSVIYGIVKRHDGWIHVHSKLGHSTTFKLYFPAFTEI
jgi:signal transduction histidine kinase